MAGPKLTRPWLVAAWPGMGAVAHLAASFLIQKLGAEHLHTVAADQYFDLRAVPVKDGLLQVERWPRSIFFGWQNPDGRDLLILLGEQQPSSDGYRYCGDMLDVATQYGVERVFTFAALATPKEPRAPARVHVAASAGELLEEIHGRSDGPQTLAEGEIGGLNGVFLAAAAARDLPGACLLGELPFFAPSVANPKAAAAVLRAFLPVAGLELDLSDLDAQAEVVDEGLAEHFERLQSSGGTPEPEFPTAYESPEDEGQEPGLDASTEARIEELFEAARQDRDRAMELKRELDRQGVFKRYEDRFLDLFKRAE